MNYKYLLTYTFEHLQPKIVESMKEAAGRFVSKQKSRVYTDILVQSGFCSPIHFTFANGTSHLRIYSKLDQAFAIEGFPSLTKNFDLDDRQQERLVNFIIRRNAYQIATETLTKEFPDLKITDNYFFTTEDYDMITKDRVTLLKFKIGNNK